MKKATAPTIKEKARLAFIREKVSQAKEKSRHSYPVPGPFTVIDRARVLEHHDPEPEENSSAIDRIEHKTLSTLSKAEIAVRYARHKQQRNASHRETHLLFKKVLKNLTSLDKYEKISIGSVFPMHLDNVEYSVIYIGDFAVFPRSAGSADNHKIPGGRPK